MSAEDLKKGLPSIFQSFIDRTVFLNCLLIDSASYYSAMNGTEQKQAFEQTKAKKLPFEKKDTSRKYVI